MNFQPLKRSVPAPKESRCKVKIKRGENGSITKEISGCSKEELSALQSQE